MTTATCAIIATRARLAPVFLCSTGGKPPEADSTDLPPSSSRPPPFPASRPEIVTGFFLAETRADTLKANWRSRHRWRSPPAETWGSVVGEITSTTAARLIAVAEEDGGNAPLIVTVDSIGGSLSAAFDLYRCFRERPAPVSCHVAKSCNSAAVCAFLGADQRTAAIGAQFIVHSVAQLGMSGRATALALRATAAELDELDQYMVSVIEWRCRGRFPAWQIANALRDERAFDAVGAWHAGLLTAAPI
jgi:ATP-dependent protease ClpP protease subunit